MSSSCEIKGTDAIAKKLQEATKKAEEQLPRDGAAIAAALAQRAFREPDLRPIVWAPLATKAMSYNLSGRVRSAREKAAQYSRKAREAFDAAKGITDKKKKQKKINAGKAANAKAKTWRGKAKEARTRAIAARQPLIDTGHLWHSITARENRIVSDAEYARYHQDGTKHIPARPFLPVYKDTVNPKARRIIETTLNRKLEDIFR